VTSSELEQAALASLAEDERSRAVVYMSDRVLEPGDELEIDGRRVQVDAPTVWAFVDLEPGVNWGHRSRYLLIDRESGSVRAVDAQFPPFMRGMQPDLKVVYRGESVPEWAVAVE
jgi:hypothetical protein